MAETVETTGESNASVSPKSSPSKKEIDAATQALNHFAQGRRHLLVNDISSAVNSLQEACRLLAEQYGETAPECGDAYYYYGRALLELARIENGVLGNALEGEEGSTEGEEEDEEEDEEAESQEEAEVPDGQGTQEEEEGEKTEEEEEVSNLQLAWEMLELAKFIFEKHDKKSKEMSLKIAQVYLKLGEVGLENENYTQSVDDFSHCLKVQTDFMEPDNRCLAETHYQLGVAHSFSDDYDNAIGSFQAAMKVIETRIENLKKKAEEKSKWSEEQRKKYAAECEDPFYSEEKEIEELDQLLPEIKEKIVDMEQMKTDSKEKIQKIAKELTLAKSIGRTSCSSSGESDSGGFSSPSKMATPQTPKLVTNISHLIRRKRKPDEEVKHDDTKKARGENTENGGVTPNGSATNGQTSPEKMETEEKASKECDDSKVAEAEASA